jgi:hypothetical protein
MRENFASIVLIETFTFSFLLRDLASFNTEPRQFQHGRLGIKLRRNYGEFTA